MTMYPMRIEEEIVFENVFRYITLSLSESLNSVSVGCADTENSEP